MRMAPLPVQRLTDVRPRPWCPFRFVSSTTVSAMNPNRILPLMAPPCLAIIVAATAASAGGDDRAAVKPDDTPVRVLVFSGAGWYRHPEIPRTNGWLVRLGQENGMAVDVTESPEDLTSERLKAYRVLVLNNANELGKVLDEKQQRAVADWFGRGNGIVGSARRHSAPGGLAVAQPARGGRLRQRLGLRPCSRGRGPGRSG